VCLPATALSTRSRRLALIAGYAAPPEPQRPEPEPERHLAVDHPGELVQMDAFCVGRLSGTKGTVWQYTAIDAAGSFCWAELHVNAAQPRRALLRRPGKARGQGAGGLWLALGARDERPRKRVSANHAFDEALARLGAQHTLISPGRPQSNGFVERV